MFPPNQSDNIIDEYILFFKNKEGEKKMHTSPYPFLHQMTLQNAQGFFICSSDLLWWKLIY